jgi:basic membrane protein A
MVKTRSTRPLAAAFLAAALALGAAETAAAGGGAQKEPPPSYKVGLLLPGPVNDGGWNASAYEGIMEIRDKYPGVLVSYQENIPPSDFEELFRAYASQGYSLVFGHGYEFGDAAVKVAKEFPRVKFCVTSSDIAVPPNVGSVRGNYREMGYLLGIVAGGMTKTNVVGAVGGMDIPSISEPAAAYAAGVAAVNPAAKVLSVTTGSFEDAARAKEAALALIEQGADILFQNADQAGFGVFEACREKGALALGAIGDQAEIAPDTVLTSGVCSLGKGMLTVFDLLMEGAWEPGAYIVGAAQGAVYPAPFRNFDSRVPGELKERLAGILEDMKSGAFDAAAFTEGADPNPSRRAR